MNLKAFLTGFLLLNSARADVLQKALAKYAKAPSIQMDIKKTEEKVALGTKSEARGQLKYQKNKIYILQEGDKKTEIFYNNRQLTLVEHPDADFGDSGKRKVTQIRKNIHPMVKNLLSLFSNPKNFSKEFKVEKTTPSGDYELIDLKPAAQTDASVKSLQLKVKKSDLTLQELSFTDDVNTRTTISFSNLKTNAKISGRDFIFKAQKNDEVLSE